MKPHRIAAACAIALALTTSVASHAQQPPAQSPSTTGQSMPHGSAHGSPHGPAHGSAHGGRHHAGQPHHAPHAGHAGHHARGGQHGHDGLMLPGAGLLRGLNLSEAQRDRVFAILHAQAPQMRAQTRDAQKAREALHQVALAGELDEARLQELAQRAARASTDLALLRARTHNALFKELTPEQQAQLKARMESRQQHGGHHRAGMHDMASAG